MMCLCTVHYLLIAPSQYNTHLHRKSNVLISKQELQKILGFKQSFESENAMPKDSIVLKETIFINININFFKIRNKPSKHI